MSKPDLFPEERAISYSKYYDWKMPPLNPLSTELLHLQPIAPEDVLPLDRLSDLLKPGYMKREQGYCVLPDGTGYHADYIWMPGVSVDMIDWWYCWHFVGPNPNLVDRQKCGNLRYKIWNPEEHIDTGFDDDFSRDLMLSDLPYRMRRYGQKNFIIERIAGKDSDVMHLHAICEDPINFGFDEKLVNMPENGTLVCGRTVTRSVLNIYQFRPCYNGVEMRIRSYTGWKFIGNGLFERDPEANASAKMLIANGTHALTEYPHLAYFLPKFYAEEACKPLDAY
ncbi:MAG: hypothetical protein LUE21_07795 [Oscillospiraceae bacterium]|nr:hypothetical protein [Oscillospiraceae bacterium]